MKTPTAKKFIAYTRVSTADQAIEGVSLEAQDTRLRAWAVAQGVELVEVVTDAGISAKTLDRPGLARVLEMLRNGEADGLVVFKLDRLTRRTVDLLMLVDELFADGSRSLVSLSESVDTASAAGRMMLTMLGALASWERETIGERTAEALRHLKAQNVKMGRDGYGWTYGEAVDDEGRRVVEPVESERAAIERAKELRAAGRSLRQIAEALTVEGHETKRGGRWHAKTVRSLIAA